MKRCSVCDRELPETEFRARHSLRAPSPDGLAYECRACHARMTRQSRGGLRQIQWSIPEALRPQIEALLDKEGITPQEYIARLVSADLERS